MYIEVFIHIYAKSCENMTHTPEKKFHQILASMIELHVLCLQGIHKNTLDSLQIPVAVHIVGLQIACLGPLVPAVDGDERCLTGMPVGIVAGMDKRLSEVLRRIVAGDGAVVCAGTVVPADAHMGIIGYGEGGIQA